jgi:predicted DNA-binding transcriptional regulator YafY
MRADRLLSIVLLLETRGRMTARQIAERLDVSPRTIQRDMDALSAAGVPVTADRGSEGGWYLLEPYQTSVTGLTFEEIMALFLNTPSNVLNDLGIYQASKAALVKLLAALPEVTRPYAEWIQQSFYIDHSNQHSLPTESAFLTIMQEAICENFCLELTYRQANQTLNRCTVNPLGLVAKGNCWYLVAADGAVCPYPLKHIEDVYLTGDRFTRPDDFNLAAYWEGVVTEFVDNVPTYTIRVRVTAEVMHQMTQRMNTVSIASVSLHEDDEWFHATLLLPNEDDACHYVLSFGASMEVLEPQSLRERVIQSVVDLLSLYQAK